MAKRFLMLALIAALALSLATPSAFAWQQRNDGNGSPVLSTVESKAEQHE